jgi:hypothetical protein
MAVSAGERTADYAHRPARLVNAVLSELLDWAGLTFE